MYNLLKSFFIKQKVSANTKEIYSEINPGDITIDCGANIGEVTENFMAKGAVVYAFEPNSYAFKKLSERFSGNTLVYCINKAVWDKQTSLKLFHHKNSKADEIHWSTGSSLLDYKGNIDKDIYEEIETIDISEFIFKLNTRIKILKIDIEGAEIEVINKLIDTNAVLLIDKIYVETHDHKIPELKEKTDLLRKRIQNEKLKNINLNWI